MSENQRSYNNLLKEFQDDGFNRVHINRAIIELGINKDNVSEVDKAKLRQKLCGKPKEKAIENIYPTLNVEEEKPSTSNKDGPVLPPVLPKSPPAVPKKPVVGRRTNYVAHFLKEATQVTKAFAQMIISKPSNPEPHIIQIMRQDRNGKKFKIDHEALATIFEHPRVVDKKIAIYSLAGPYRKGKSFMLNLFLLYLWSGRSPKWLNDKQKTLSRGFGWRGGAERDTQGILIWNEPFFVETEQGEVAVFLMDTQGTYDNQMDRMACVAVFALSTLISSVQIFNLSQQIEEIHLQELQFFTQYGRYMQNRTGSLSPDTKPFQTLLFLIRDWQDPDGFSYGYEGGQQYLQFQNNVPTDISDLVSVRKNLDASFSKVRCWLTPYPKLKIVTRSRKAGPCSIDDIGTEFLNNVDELVKYLFTPANIAVKRIDGHDILGGDFVNYVTGYGEMLKDGNMPKPQTAFEMTATAHIRKCMQKCSNDYYSGMIEFVNEQAGFIQREILMEVSHQRMNMAMERFDNTRHMASDDQIKHYREGLLNQINQKFETFEKQNNNKWTSLTNECGDMAFELCEEIKTDILKFLNNKYVPEAELQAYGDKLKSQAKDQYKKFNPLRKYDKSSKEYEEYLVDKIETVLQRMANFNLQNKSKIENDLSARVSNSKKRYVLEMERACHKKYVEPLKLEKIHQKASAVAWNKFGIPEGGHDPDAVLQMYIVKLQRLITTEYDKYIKRNKLNKEMISKRTAETVFEARTLYRKEMLKLLGDNCRKQDEIMKAHNLCKRATDALMESMIKEQGPIFCEHYQEQIEVCLKDTLNTFMCENEDTKRENIVEFHQQKQMAFALYDEEMEKITTKYIGEDELAREHDANVQKAFNCYGLIEDREPIFQYDKILKQLTQEINGQFQLFREENEQNKKRLKDYLDMENEKLKSYYVDHMEKLCSGKFVKERILAKHHDAIVQELASVVRRALENKKLLAEFQDTCLDDLRDLYAGVLENNRRNRKYFLRRMVESIFGSGGKPPLEESEFSQVFASLSVIGGTTWDRPEG